MADLPIHKVAARLRVVQRARDLLGPDADWDPLDTLIEIALGSPPTQVDELPDGSPNPVLAPPDIDQRAHAAQKLAEYVHPKLKQIEVTGSGGKPLFPVSFVLPTNGRLDAPAQQPQDEGDGD